MVRLTDNGLLTATSVMHGAFALNVGLAPESTSSQLALKVGMGRSDGDRIRMTSSRQQSYLRPFICAVTRATVVSGPRHCIRWPRCKGRRAVSVVALAQLPCSTPASP
jgi:hypothetical protein